MMMRWKLLWLAFMLSITSTNNALAQMGVLYANFPQSFSHFDKKTFDKDRNAVQLNSGEWELYNISPDSIGGRESHHAIAKENKCATSYLQMNFVATAGAWKVQFAYDHNCCPEKRHSAFQLEFSVDKGRRWEKMNEEYLIIKGKKKLAVFHPDIKEPVRFRILRQHSEQCGEQTNLLTIDDFCIYQKEKYH